MNPVSEAAIEQAKLETADALADSMEALARRIQRDHDIAFSVISRGLPDGERKRWLEGLLIPGLDSLRPKELKPLACPLCAAGMIRTTREGKLVWEHPKNDCLFSESELAGTDVAKWNQRPKNNHVTTIACSKCGSVTPAATSQVCGYADCPCKEMIDVS